MFDIKNILWNKYFKSKSLKTWEILFDEWEIFMLWKKEK